MGDRYHQIYDGDWHEMYKRGQKMACCHCGLVHVMDFKVEKKGRINAVFVRVKQDRRATAAIRRPFKFEKDDE